jgi:hypothetical protein
MVLLNLSRPAPLSAQEELFDPFETELHDTHRIYDEAIHDIWKRFKTKNPDAIVQRLVNLTDKSPSPALAYIVGERTIGLDPDTSYRLLKRAYEARPNSPDVILAVAQARHRKQEYAQALELYDKYFALRPDDLGIGIFLADCLVREGKLARAVAAWEMLEHPRAEELKRLDQRPQDATDEKLDQLRCTAWMQCAPLASAICDVYSGPSIERTRADLLRAVNSGDSTSAEKLIDCDLFQTRDWWSFPSQSKDVLLDLQVVEKVLKPGSQRYQDLGLLVGIVTGTRHDPSEQWTHDKLAKSQLIVGANSRLPQSSLIARRLCGIVTHEQIVPARELLDRFENELLQRAKSERGDHDAMLLLCNLCRTADDKEIRVHLEQYERYGWDRYKDGDFALGVLRRLMNDGKLQPDTDELKRALREFPADSEIHKVAIQCCPKKDLTPEMIVGAIKAECHHLSVGPTQEPDTYTLDSYFASLKSLLH